MTDTDVSAPVRDLIRRLEEATEGSRELDVAVLASDGGPVEIGVEHYTEYVRREWARCGDLQTWLDEVPHYTTSIDAALTLVPEGWRIDQLGEWRAHSVRKKGPWYAILWRIGSDDLDWSDARSQNSPTAAIALCIAALKAGGLR